MNNRVIQVFEYERLAVGQDFTEAHFKRLADYNFRSKNQYFIVGHNCVRFQNYVGVIQVGNLTIEILPKTDRNSHDKRKWQSVLIQMLHQTGYLPVESLSEANLSLKHTSILLKLFFEQYLIEVDGLAHQGLTKKYRRRSDNMTKLKGRLLFPEHIKHNIVHKERFFTEHQCYDKNNKFNQILLAAIRILINSPTSPQIAGRAKLLEFFFDGVDTPQITEKTFMRLRYGRNTERYRKAVNLARMIILSYSPDVRSGKEDVLAILFDMNLLFEKYVYYQMKRAERQYGDLSLRIRGQSERTFWGSKRIKPDIVMSFQDGSRQNKIILDTKWKIPKTGQPLDSDLKQMYAYNVHFGADRSFLVYPQTRESRQCYSAFSSSRALPQDYSHGCGMHFLDLFDADGKLSRQLGQTVIETMTSLEKAGL